MDFSQESILITGGAGFIGSHIVENLINYKPKLIRIFDNLSTGNIKNISPFLNNYHVEFFLGDITNLEQCHRACKGITLICHQAALGSVPRSVDDPIKSHINNVDGFLNILVAARDAKIKRVVYASSSAVYGDDEHAIKIENQQGNPLSPYAITKCVNELYGKVFTNLYGLQCIGLRYFNVFGPRQNPDGCYAAVIPKFIKILISGQVPIINGSGEYSRDFTYIDNIVYANLLALKTENKICFGEAYNVGTEGNITIKSLYESLISILKLDHILPIYGETRIGDVPYSRASTNKIHIHLGYNVKVPFDEGLQKTVNYFKL